MYLAWDGLSRAKPIVAGMPQRGYPAIAVSRVVPKQIPCADGEWHCTVTPHDRRIAAGKARSVCVNTPFRAPLIR